MFKNNISHYNGTRRFKNQDITSRYKFDGLITTEDTKLKMKKIFIL